LQRTSTQQVDTPAFSMRHNILNTRHKRLHNRCSQRLQSLAATTNYTVYSPL